jgi:hypothetical protein
MFVSLAATSLSCKMLYIALRTLSGEAVRTEGAKPAAQICLSRCVTVLQPTLTQYSGLRCTRDSWQLRTFGIFAIARSVLHRYRDLILLHVPLIVAAATYCCCVRHTCRV